MTNKQRTQISIGSAQGTGKMSYIEDVIKSYFPKSSPVYKKFIRGDINKKWCLKVKGCHKLKYKVN